METLVQPSSRPSAVSFGYQKYSINRKENKHSAKCRFCRSVISEKLGTSSNFTRHLKLRHRTE